LKRALKVGQPQKVPKHAQQVEEGWSELAATNAPVADEPVEAVFWMNENLILPTRIIIFFSTSSLPQNFPPSYLPSTSLLLPTFYLLPPTYLLLPTLLPTTYQPHPPSLHRQSSRDLERLWSGSWSCGCGAGAGAGAGPAGVGAGPTHPRKCKMLTFFFCLFCLKKA